MFRLNLPSAKVLMFFCCACVVSESALAGVFACDAPQVTVLAEERQDVDMACEAAADAIEFLDQLGLDVSTKVFIEIVSALETRESNAVAGYFIASSRKGVVLNFREFLKYGDWFRVAVNAELFRALVAHEVAHVIAAYNFKITKPTVQAQEYIAYVTTFAVMEANQREVVLGRFSGDGFETEQQMSTTIYLCDPMRFGVESYRHFIRQADKAGYFQAILSGRALSGW